MVQQQAGILLDRQRFTIEGMHTLTFRHLYMTRLPRSLELCIQPRIRCRDKIQSSKTLFSMCHPGWLWTQGCGSYDSLAEDHIRNTSHTGSLQLLVLIATTY